MTSKEFIRKSFELERGTDGLMVYNKDRKGLTVMSFHKTYFSPSNIGALFELDFGTGPEIWTLGEMTAVLLTENTNAEILNVTGCSLKSNGKDRWIEV